MAAWDRSTTPALPSASPPAESPQSTRNINQADSRLAGRLLGECDSNATIDAHVVAAASRDGGATVLTSDVDLVELAAGLDNVRVQLL